MSKLAASRLSELQAIQENAQTAAMLASASALELSEARSDLETARAACQEKQDLVQALLGSQAEREERAVGLAAEASAAIKLAARRKEELDAVGSKVGRSAARSLIKWGGWIRSSGLQLSGYWFPQYDAFGPQVGERTLAAQAHSLRLALAGANLP